MNDKDLAAVAIVCLTGLEGVNLIMRGPDGAILTGIVGAIAGLGGYMIRGK